MPGLLWTVWGWLWPLLRPLVVYALPYMGPLRAALAPLAAIVPGLGGMGRVIRIASYVLVLGFGAFWGVKALHWWEGDKITQIACRQQINAQCSAAVMAASLSARESALKGREMHLAARVEAVEEAEKQIKGMQDDLERQRTIGPRDGAPVVGLDDKWLRAWIGRK